MTARTLKALVLGAGLVAPAAALADFQSCLAGIGQEAAGHGVSTQTFRTATAGISFDDKVIELSQKQPEFKTPIWDYMAALVDDERVEDGRAAGTVADRGRDPLGEVTGTPPGRDGRDDREGNRR